MFRKFTTGAKYHIKQIGKLKKALKFRKILVALTFAFLVFAILFLATALWEKNAIQTKIAILNVEIENTNSSKIYHITTQADIELYFPLAANNYQSNITIIRDSYRTSSGEIVHPPPQKVLDTEAGLASAPVKIKVESFEGRYYYGTEEINSPVKEVNPSFFTSLRAFPMTKSSYIIKWSYEIPEINNERITKVELNYWTGTLGPNLMRPFSSLFSQDGNGLTSDIIFYLSITAAGFALASLIFRKQFDLKRAGNYFLKDFNSEKNKNSTQQISSNLKILECSPNLIGGFTRIIFGLSILLFKSRMNYQIKKLQIRSALKDDKETEGVLATYLATSDTKLADLIPEQKTILLILGFLASVGISFSWNLGAMTPLLYSLALFYVFLNLGSSLYLLKESTTDQIWILIFIFGLIFALVLPQIIEMLRTEYAFRY
jgi:hypothetical protein